MENLFTHILNSDRDSGGSSEFSLVLKYAAFMNVLDNIMEAIVRKELPTLHPALAGLTKYPYLRQTKANTSAYIDIFIDNFLGLAQGPPTSGAKYGKPFSAPWKRCSVPVTLTNWLTVKKSCCLIILSQVTLCGRPARSSRGG